MSVHNATILGGLPVVVDVNFGRDSWTGECYSEVESIWWMKRNGKAGKSIPDHIWNRAEKYDPYFSEMTTRIVEDIAAQLE